MKLIFLDIDGVLNNWHYSVITKSDNYKPSSFDPVSVALLIELVEETRSRIVICSTWRHHIGTTIEWWNGLFAAYGLDFYDDLVIGLTPDLNTSRGDEVKSFLNNFKNNVEAYVILDDTSDYLIDQPFVQIDGVYGLIKANIEHAKLILNKSLT